MTPSVRFAILNAFVSCLHHQMACMSADSEPGDVLRAAGNGAAQYLALIGEE